MGNKPSPYGDPVDTVDPTAEEDVGWQLENVLELLAKDAALEPAVLVVDDEPGIVEEISEDLKLEGIECDTASTGEEALARIGSREDIQIVIADIRMPGMDGLELVRQARERFDNREILFIMLTGHAGFDEAVDALRLETFEFLTKPVSLAHLLHVVNLAKEVLGLRTHERNLKEFLVNEIARQNTRYERLKKENDELKRRLADRDRDKA